MERYVHSIWKKVDSIDIETNVYTDRQTLKDGEENSGREYAGKETVMTM